MSEYQIQEFGKTEVKDLKENGQQIAVTEANKREYVQLACQMKMTESIKSQIKSFLDGFYEIIPKHLISIFNEQELELLISGLPTIDIDDLKANTEYRSYQESSLQVRLSCLSFTPSPEFWAQTNIKRVQDQNFGRKPMCIGQFLSFM